MKFTRSEKMEIIRMVEESKLSVKRTLEELDVSRSSFYSWYRKYEESGFEGLADKHRRPIRVWNQIPEWEKERVVETARCYPEKSCREIACYVTDNLGSFISESSVYRILKAMDLVTSPVYTVISAKDKFENPTSRVNQLWQTDFTYFKIVHWGWYYLSTVLDDYSRYIITWRLCNSMMAEDVMNVLDSAISKTGVDHVNVYQKPRLLSDNGPCFISGELKKYLVKNDIPHTRTRVYHPMTQGKIERYHRSMKNLILLDIYYTPEQLSEKIEEWVEYYNNHRYHEAINNVTPADRYFGREKDILKHRKKAKEKTLKLRRRLYEKYCRQNLISATYQE